MIYIYFVLLGVNTMGALLTDDPIKTAMGFIANFLTFVLIELHGIRKAITGARFVGEVELKSDYDNYRANTNHVDDELYDPVDRD